MARPNRIIVTHVQSVKIQTLLKADNGKAPVQELIDTIVKDAEVEEWVAKRFADAWRWNHRNDNDNIEPKPEKKEELFYTSRPLPEMKKKGTTSNPENGTGKVAQIIQLAQQGKSVQEIIEMGFNKSTVYRQVSEWRKRTKEQQHA
jgi:polyhydroxyalkanoate synthesis regulator phasin